MPNLYCDNYATCHSYLVDRGTLEQTETRARIHGWHIFHGETMGGRPHEGILCPKCVGPSHRPRAASPDMLPGQGELFAA